MKLKNVLIAVNDVEKSIAFYRELFGLEVLLDNDGNVIMTEGLVLQDARIWQTFTGKEIIPPVNYILRSATLRGLSKSSNSIMSRLRLSIS